MMNHILFLVKADLLLQEKTFDKLQKFVKQLYYNEKYSYDYYNIIDLSDDDIVYKQSETFTFDQQYQGRINCYIKSGYMLINLEELRKFLSIEF